MPRRSGGRFVEEDRATLGGDKPVNPSGGLKSYGHPIGATGVRMLTELTVQLQGRAGQRQVANAGRGLAHNRGGPGAVSCVTILGKDKQALRILDQRQEPVEDAVRETPDRVLLKEVRRVLVLDAVEGAAVYAG